MNIPFFPNTGDGTHCFQAVLKMALAYFEPRRAITYAELDRLSGKEPGKWTWPTTAMLWLMKNGYEVRLVELFDYDAFAERGGDYLIEKCGHEVGQAQIANTDIEREQAVAAQFSAYAPLDQRIPSLEDISRFMEDNWVVICNINAALLRNLSGYSGHFVVPVEVTDREIAIHDPGLPPQERFAVSRADFERAWAYPGEGDKNLLAIRILP